ncbi:hypothetical protein BH708_17330 [Brachybacterium sp. P6-10-X1]|uniref:DUF1684 domain-containing protein n=1 Tax=Brachybacterium sp. P6-10-X1 TaxID=1903186 RepID=UPI000971B023|nr:DUF1684 domain-containing protein [Brachybacterium sp. P6-10-X1]APX34175.1 hypothetical protein BH708_17330 [Brachybacterium sp. P6-10-X1]
MSTTENTPGSTDESIWRTFRRNRDESLADPHGILAQVGLHWIDPSAGPQRLDGIPGSWEVVEGRLVAEFEDAAFEDTEPTLLAAADEVDVRTRGERTTATVTGTGDVRLARFGDDVQIDVIRRGGRIGLRLLDPAAPRRAAFDGVPTFPYNPEAVLTGTWRREPTTVTVGSALPWLTQELPSPGVATLDTSRGPVELLLTGESSIVFTDVTSGTESADWRQVTAQLDGDAVRVDLNYALNFPSAFSVWGTCPRSPEGNHLPRAVRAGERRVEPTER